MVFFECICKNGFQRSGFNCVDIDECDINNYLSNCDPIANCSNTIGGYTCTCPTGYSDVNGNGWVCEDFNECNGENGGNNCASIGSVCINLPGSFRCECLSGYQGNGLNCTKINNPQIVECNGGIVNIPGDCKTFLSSTIWSASSSVVIINSQNLDITPVSQLEIQGTIVLDNNVNVIGNYQKGKPIITAVCANLTDAGTLTIHSDSDIPDGERINVIQVKDDNCLQGDFDKVTLSQPNSDSCVSTSLSKDDSEKSISYTVHTTNTCNHPGLSDGAIAGIVIGCAAFVIILIVVIAVLSKGKGSGGSGGGGGGGCGSGADFSFNSLLLEVKRLETQYNVPSLRATTGKQPVEINTKGG